MRVCKCGYYMSFVERFTMMVKKAGDEHRVWIIGLKM